MTKKKSPKKAGDYCVETIAPRGRKWQPERCFATYDDAVDHVTVLDDKLHAKAQVRVMYSGKKVYALGGR